MLKYLYVDVILRTSIFPALFGLATAVHVGVAELTQASYLAFLISIIGILIVQGVIEHGLDILLDKGGFSAFRYKVTEEEAKKIKRNIKISYIVLAVLALVLLSLKKFWLVVVGLMAIRSAKLYVQTHNEWYSVFGFMLSFSVGYFSFTNAPTTAWLLGAMVVGFIMKSSQAMYRLDDYLQKELCEDKRIIQYYRNIFRNTIHLVPLAVTAIILSPTVNINYNLWFVWAAGMLLFAYQVLRLKNRIMQEVNLAPLIVAIIAVELLSGNLSLRYAITTSIALYCFAKFWKNRHAMCNIIICPRNPLRKVEVPR